MEFFKLIEERLCVWLAQIPTRAKFLWIDWKIFILIREEQKKTDFVLEFQQQKNRTRYFDDRILNETVIPFVNGSAGSMRANIL